MDNCSEILTEIIPILKRIFNRILCENVHYSSIMNKVIDQIDKWVDIYSGMPGINYIDLSFLVDIRFIRHSHRHRYAFNLLSLEIIQFATYHKVPLAHYRNIEVCQVLYDHCIKFRFMIFSVPVISRKIKTPKKRKRKNQLITNSHMSEDLSTKKHLDI